MLITAQGAICAACHQKQEALILDRRADIALRLGRGEPENAFGDATFDGRKRKRAVLLFVVTMGLLAVIYALKLARVM